MLSKMEHTSSPPFAYAYCAVLTKLVGTIWRRTERYMNRIKHYSSCSEYMNRIKHTPAVLSNQIAQLGKGYCV